VDCEDHPLGASYDDDVCKRNTAPSGRYN